MILYGFLVECINVCVQRHLGTILFTTLITVKSVIKVYFVFIQIETDNLTGRQTDRQI